MLGERAACYSVSYELARKRKIKIQGPKNEAVITAREIVKFVYLKI